MPVNKAIIIGFGHHASQRLLVAVRLTNQFEELLIFDKSEIALQSLEEEKNSEMPSIRPYTNWDECKTMLDDNTLAIISTTADSHLHYFTELAELGLKYIYIEKPLAQSVQDALKIQDTANKLNIKVAVGFYTEYLSISQNIDKYIEKYELGDCVKIIAQGGNVDFSAMGVHLIDLAKYIFQNKPLKVFGHISGKSVNPRGSQYNNHGGIAHILFPESKELILSFHTESNVTYSLEILFVYGIIKVHLDDGYLEVYTVNERQPVDLLYKHQQVKMVDKIDSPNNFIEYFSQIFMGLANDANYPDLGKTMDATNALLAIFISHDLDSSVTLPVDSNTKYFDKQYRIT